MKVDNIKAAAAALWVSGVGAAGLLVDVTSPSSWIVLVGCAGVPLLIMARYWNYRDQTMSESTQQVVR
jgi:hypothetical protein